MQIVEIKTTVRFDRSLSKLPYNIQQETVKKVAIFKEDPFDARLKTHKLQGRLRDRWSFSINYQIRIIFRIWNHNRALFYDIGNHKIYQ